MTFIRFLMFSALAMVIAGCGDALRNERPAPSIDGVWAMMRVEYPAGGSYEYSNQSNTYLRFCVNDSCYHICVWASSPNGEAIVPDSKGTYTLIDKGNGEVLYLEDGDPRPLCILNDSTITIQKYGIVRTWVRVSTLSESTKKDMLRILEQVDYSSDNAYDRYFFTKAESELKAQNSVMMFAILALVLGISVAVHIAMRNNRNRKRVEAQLRQMAEEREDQPQIITETLHSVEEEFLCSDYYADIHKRIADGNNLTPADWTQMEREINKVYPSFTMKLFNLYRMSVLEYRVCLLIKLRIPPTDMASLLNKEASTISSTRSRLYKKIFNKKGGAKDWDEFVLSL